MAAIKDIQRICYDAEICPECPFWRRLYDGSCVCYFNDKIPGEWVNDKIEEMIDNGR